MKTTLFYLLLFLPFVLIAQRGVVSGVMKDMDGVPLPGCSVVVEGTYNGTQTDFDGNYTIECSVGDVLVFTYVGLKTQRITVDRSMFESGKIPSAPRIWERPKLNKDFSDSLVYGHRKAKEITDFGGLSRQFTFEGPYLQINRIKEIKADSTGYFISQYPSELYYSIELDQKTSTQFLPKSYRPQLQTRFAQGRPTAAGLSWFGPESGELFSFGPRLSDLEYDGSAYPFDEQGRLVNRGQGSGAPALPYDNSILRRGTSTTTSIQFRLAKGSRYQLGLLYRNNRRKDLFDRASDQSNHLSLDGDWQTSEIEFKGRLNYSTSATANANLNGLHSQVLQSAWISPPSFSNTQGIRLEDSSQRSFGPDQVNNPNWLLTQNENQFSSELFKTSVSARGRNLLGITAFTIAMSYGQQKQDLDVFLPRGSVGYMDQYNSEKNFDRRDYTAGLNLDFYSLPIGDSQILFESDFSFQNTQLDYNFEESEGDDAFQNVQSVQNNTLQWTTKSELDTNIGDIDFNLGFWNSAFISRVQGSRWFLPRITGSAELDFYSDTFKAIKVLFAHTKNVIDFPLFYDNTSHNSLRLNQQDNLSYRANNDLFLSSDLKFEEVDETNLQLGIYLLNRKIELSAEYFDSRNRNSIFPVFDAGQWGLKNAVNIRNTGFEFLIDLNFFSWRSDTFHWNSRLTFTQNRPVVQKLQEAFTGSIPIAGFQGIRKELIPGEPVGVLVGSGYLRNEAGERIIGDDGFPLSAEEVVIGNPNPDFQMGFFNRFKLEEFSFQFLLDFQSGGDVWNGTQGLLNYYGTSQETARLRGTQNFIYEGVNLQGQPNTQAVAFAPETGNVLENPWTRYGYGGLDEASIQDGTYLNLRSISLSYTKEIPKEDFVFREISVSLYARNLLRWGMARELNPYSSLYGGSSATGLHFFNQPLLTETGLTINLKI